MERRAQDPHDRRVQTAQHADRERQRSGGEGRDADDVTVVDMPATVRRTPSFNNRGQFVTLVPWHECNELAAVVERRRPAYRRRHVDHGHVVRVAPLTAAPLPLAIRVLRRLNPAIVWILRSPLHRLLSANLLALTYTGASSGVAWTLPLSYVALGGRLYLCTRSSRWWR